MANVKIKETTLKIPTYTWKDEDIEPPFLREFTPRGQPIYPYTVQEIIAKKKTNRSFRAVVLENEYLKLTFLPELNGRLYSLFDKVNKREILYKNKTIKPALFGLRGVWAAAGIEYNFPNSHSVTSLEPVCGEVKRYEDGSASFISGDIEWVSRMGWSVEMKLAPGSALVEMESKLYNLTAFPQRFFYWINAGVPLYPDTKFIYPPSTRRLYVHPPMDNSRIAHLDYPVHHGRDISLAANITQQFPAFAEKMEEDFFGIYHSNIGSGLVHIADHLLVPGRKIWDFGNSRDGKTWGNLLKDGGPDYCEVQAGPFTLQSDYRMLPPEKMSIQNDFWFPISGIGGFNTASKELAANVQITRKVVKIFINSVSVRKNLKVRVKIKNRLAAEKNVAVLPLKPLFLSFNLPSEPENGKITIIFQDESGDEILVYPGKIEKTRTESSFSKSLISEGRYLEEQGYPEKALETYRRKAKTDCRAKISQARLIAASGKFRKAFEQLEEVLSVDKKNPEALYFSGICLKELENYPEAEKRFAQLAENTLFAETALFWQTKIAVIRKNYSQALKYFRQFPNSDLLSSYNLSLAGLSLRKSGQAEKAKNLLDKSGKRFLFDPLAWGESYLLKKKDQKNAFPGNTQQQIIEIVCRYLDLNEPTDGLRIIDAYLKKKNVRLIDPDIFYYRGYLEMRLGRKEEAQYSFRKAKLSDGKNGFSFRLESEAVLKTALEADPGDYRALYQLGNLLAFKNRWPEAVSCWEKVRGNNLSLALRNLGIFHWKIKNQPESAVVKYREAIALKTCGAKTIWEYDHLMEELNRGRERIGALKKKWPVVQKDRRLLLRFASACVAGKRYTEALKILESGRFPLCEGKMLPRLLYEEACCRQGNAYAANNDLQKTLYYYRMPLKYPENLGTGKPSCNLEAEWWFRSGKILEKLGRPALAQRYFRNGGLKGDGIDVEYFPLKKLVLEHQPDVVDIYYWINYYFRILCLQENREDLTAQKLLRKMASFAEVKLREGRGDETEIRLLQALTFHVRGDRQKTAGYLNLLPVHQIPYGRITDFLRQQDCVY